jgi:hypothetical protein
MRARLAKSSRNTAIRSNAACWHSMPPSRLILFRAEHRQILFTIVARCQNMVLLVLWRKRAVLPRMFSCLPRFRVKQAVVLFVREGMARLSTGRW